MQNSRPGNVQNSSGPRWLERGYAALFLLLPWSVEINFGNWKMVAPAEPLILLIGIGLCAHFFRRGKIAIQEARLLSKGGANHWQTALCTAALAWIIWQGMATFCSTMPLVSLKYWVVEAGHWWVFFVGLLVFPGLWQRILPLFLLSMAGSVVWTLAQHSGYHFRPDQSNLAPMPFFPDHTLYGAVLAMLLPWTAVLGASSASPASNLFQKWPKTALVFKIALLLLLLAGLYFSYCRAAWLSLVLAGGLGLALVFWKKWRWFALAGLLAAGFLIVEKEKIARSLARPSADGNAPGLSAQLRSLTNFKTDASNLERLNRYACARRMAAARPWVGFGPGTFQFQYLPYQRPEEMTRISITEPIRERNPSNYGRGGGAHSEYFQALAETGWPGLCIWALLVGLMLFSTCRTFFQAQSRPAEKWIYWASLLSVSTFVLHAGMNNFLHDGRLAMLFWGQIAIVALKTGTTAPAWPSR